LLLIQYDPVVSIAIYCYLLFSLSTSAFKVFHLNIISLSSFTNTTKYQNDCLCKNINNNFVFVCRYTVSSLWWTN